MQKIAFTSGTIQSFDRAANLYTLCLFNGGKRVYIATIDGDMAAGLIDQYNNKKIKLVS